MMSKLDEVIDAYLIHQDEKKRMEVFDKKISLATTEVSALQAQINPHFLYNTLDCIRGEALIAGNETIAQMTGMLSSIFRYSISKKNDIVSLYEELQNIRQYMKIQEFRFEDRFKMEVTLNTLNDEREIFMPKMLIQPVVENAILHGLGDMEDGGLIRIFVTQRKETTVIEITDNGQGMTEEQLAKLNESGKISEKQRTGGKGIAIRNIRERIKLYFGADYGLNVYSTLGVGTKVVITLPNLESAQIQLGLS